MLKDLHSDLERHGVALVFAHISESFKADLDHQGLTEVIGPNRQFETLREMPRRLPGLGNGRAAPLYTFAQELLWIQILKRLGQKVLDVL
jgi:hypothetical protein